MERKLFNKLILGFFACFLFLYFSFLFLCPAIVNSKIFSSNVEKFFQDKKNISLKITNLNLKTHWNFSSDFYVENINVSSFDSEELLVLDNLKFNLVPYGISKLDLDYIFADALKLRDIFSSDSSSNKQFELKRFPVINVKNAQVVAFKSDENNFIINANTISIVQNLNDIICKLNIVFNSSYLDNDVIIGTDGNLIYKNSELYANNLSASFGSAKLFINGKVFDKLNKTDLKITGKDIPIHDLQASLLYFQKLKKKGKVFIENFYDFSGLVDVDLSYADGLLRGFCNTKGLSAKSVLFNVPIYFKNALFNFVDKSIWTEAQGTIGDEKVYAKFILTGMGTENQEVNGSVISKLSNDFAASYIPDLRISGLADTSVDYNIKNGKVFVSYLVKLNSGSDLYYKTANLGLFAYDRRLFVKTEKQGDKLEIIHYDYSLRDGAEITNIVLGDALFLRENGKLTLQYINGKTNGYAPVSVTGSFGEYVDGGLFNGDLRYDHKKKIITGDFSIIDSNYKDFYLEKAEVSADENVMNIYASGSYDDYPYNCRISAKNDFVNKIKIYDMDLFLKEFIVRRGDYKVKTKRLTTSEHKKDIDISIDKWKIKLDKISHKRIVLENILMSGSLNNDIFKFLMSDVSFARGKLNADGWYNFKSHSSCIDFSAENVDSNIFADVIFGLPNQISGLASATLRAESKNKLNDINADLSFTVKEGYLPKLGSTEFIINKSKKVKKPLKIKLADIINIDISKSKALASDLNGSLSVDNYKISDINLTSQQKYLSLLVEGDYDIKAQDADLKLWGKYNKSAQSKVKILFVPLSWIVKIIFKPEKTKQLYQNKINEIPAIVASPKDEQAFRVKLKGNINNNNVNVELKSII